MHKYFRLTASFYSVVRKKKEEALIDNFTCRMLFTNYGTLSRQNKTFQRTDNIWSDAAALWLSVVPRCQPTCHQHFLFPCARDPDELMNYLPNIMEIMKLFVALFFLLFHGEFSSHPVGNIWATQSFLDEAGGLRRYINQFICYQRF